MLHELAEYAAKQRLATQPGYKAKHGKWAVVLERGRYVGVFNYDRPFSMAPDLTQPELVGGGKDGARCHFLLDSAKVATGYLVESAQDANKHANFVALMRDAAGDTPELLDCVALFDDADLVERIHNDMKEVKVKPGDALTFVVDGDYLPELTSWHGWWQRYRASLAKEPATGASADRMVDFLSGELVSPALTHGKVALSRVGGTAFGSALISFDKEAFESFGFQQSENAAVSEEGVAAYVAALNALAAGVRSPLGGMLILHWYDRPIPPDLDPMFAGLLDEPDEDPSKAVDARLRMEKILAAVREGNYPEFSNNRYHVLSLTGSAGRVMVRDWFTGDVHDLVANIQQWFDDLDIVGPTGRRVANAPKLFALLMRMVDYRPNERIGDTSDRIKDQLPPTMPALWRSILKGGPLPDAVAYAGLRYAESRYLRSDDEDGANNLDRLACGLVRAWFNRNRDNQKEGMRLTTHLDGQPVVDENLESPAYHIGRLLAYMDYMQQLALDSYGDDEKRTGDRLGKRFYSAASTRPELVLARMTDNAEAYLAKIRRDKSPYKESEVRSEFTAIVRRLRRQVLGTLSLNEQALFMIGFYEQQAEIVRLRNARAAERKAAKAGAAGAEGEVDESVSTDGTEFDETGAN